MRKTSRLLLTFLLLFTLFSCDDDEPADVLNLSSSVLRFSSGSGQYSLVVESNVPFEGIKAGTTSDWVFAEAREGQQFLVTVPENPDPTVRAAVITIVAGKCVKEVDVLQEGRPADLELTAETGKCWDLNTQVPIGIKTKERWTATVSGDWFLLREAAEVENSGKEISGTGDACIYAFFEPNTTDMERKGEVTVKLKNGTERTFSFVQSAALPDLGRKGDSLALVAIYNKFDGAKWGDTYWCQPGKPINKWQGVFVNEESGRVEKLYLTTTMKCEGEEFPEEIKNLTALEEFKCVANNYKGTLPYNLLRCTKLKWLTIKECGLHGILEPWIGSFGYLSVLELNSAKLTGTLPYELQAPYILQTMDLSMNEFTGEIPPCWNMTYLITMNLMGNKLSGYVPDNIGEMPRLSYLYLSRNTDLVGPMPESFCRRWNIGYIMEYATSETGIERCKTE